MPGFGGIHSRLRNTSIEIYGMHIFNVVQDMMPMCTIRCRSTNLDESYLLCIIITQSSHCGIFDPKKVEHCPKHCRSGPRGF